MSEEQEQTTHVTESSGDRTQGRVKWFNNKAGYGFITVVSDDKEKYHDHDIFVHHSALTTKEDHIEPKQWETDRK